MNPYESLKTFGFTQLHKEFNFKPEFKWQDELQLAVPSEFFQPQLVEILDDDEIYSLACDVLGENCILSDFRVLRQSLLGNEEEPKAFIHSPQSVVGIEEALDVCFYVFFKSDRSYEKSSVTVWPYSHNSGKLPSEVEGAKEIDLSEGNVVVLLGQTWSRIDLEPSQDEIIKIQFCRWWKQPHLDFTQCGEDVYENISSQVKHLFGFTSRPPISSDHSVYTLKETKSLSGEYNQDINLDVYTDS